MFVRATSNSRKKVLLGQLGSYGDCLYATAIARQIKSDNPECCLVWAIGSMYRSVLDYNPFVDEVWEIPIENRNDLLLKWRTFESEVIDRWRTGEFSEVYLTQIFPGNLAYFDGTLRASMFRVYPKPVTVPIAPVIRLSYQEIDRVKMFAERYQLSNYRHVILFETSPQSGQSFVTPEYSLLVANRIVNENPDVAVILSSNFSLGIDNDQIIDGSCLSFRENAELTHYCSLFIGCSSGISWLCTSDWAKPIPKIILLDKSTGNYASMICDHSYFNLDTRSIIEIDDPTPDYLVGCVKSVMECGVNISKSKYCRDPVSNYKFYFNILRVEMLNKGLFADAYSSLKYAISRYGLNRDFFFGFFSMITKLFINFFLTRVLRRC